MTHFGRLLIVVIAAVLVFSCSKKEEKATADVEKKTTADAEKKTPTKVSSSSAKTGWLTSYEQAQQEAKAGRKLILMDFTGSDWCGWCILLDKEVFSKPEFQEYARKNLVLLELDFPRMKPMSAENQEQNERLARQYQIQGFPTIVVLDSGGKQVGELGYVPGGPAAFIAELEKVPKG
ncbi:MAG: thioredoxin family protein [Chthoniobacterales bacterium]|nr:MAG: thioredoxin family protein [Chthoniobacterales bacterium]